MKPLITTVRSIHELATGLSPGAISSSPVLFEFEGTTADYLISADDDEETQRVVLLRDGNVKERYVPEQLADARREVLSRMASFAERARTLPLSLPWGWRQYKEGNLVAFFAVPSGDARSTRWIAEVLPGGRGDVVFWRTTTSGSQVGLAEFEASRPKTIPGIDGDWARAFETGRRYFAQTRRSESVSDVDIDLPALAQSPTKGWSYDRWLEAVNDEQRAFIEAPTDKSIRLRGPAGSGKTLALTLKAVREVLRARDAGEKVRVLVVTHSWALTAQITDSIDAMGLGFLDELDAFPLLAIAQAISPAYVRDATGFHLIGEDSFSGKQAQLDQILELLDEFIAGDWVTYRAGVSNALSIRFDSPVEEDRMALAWDLLVEFGSVIGAAAIFPGAGSELRYMQLQRASWMLPLNRADLHMIFTLYCNYMTNLDARSLMTSDQVLADFLSHLETHAWNRLRKTEGYDFIFVDEFHLFSPLERHVLHYLTRDPAIYPRIFMALDPRQSPSEAFIGIAADKTWSPTSASMDDDLGEVANFELKTVHRFTPQILELIKHIHYEYPVFSLDQQWDIDFTAVDSSQSDGPVPRLVSSASRSAEETDVYRAVQQLYVHGRIALAIVDIRQWPRFSELASRIGQSARYHVSPIAGRSDIEGLGYRRRGLVVGPAEYLAGLQFETVLVAGMPDLHAAMPVFEKTRLLSLLYLGISRAQREVRVFVNEDDGGAPEVLLHAVANGRMEAEQGSLA